MYAATVAPSNQPSAVGVSFNRKGFITDFDDWNPVVATALASEQGLELSECHWAVIEFLRDYYEFHQMPPTPKVVIRELGQRLSPHTPCTKRKLEGLFPDGGCRQACQIAGLPDYYCHSC